MRPVEAHRSVKSYNNHTGVPLSLARMPRNARFGVFEMGMNHAGELAELTRLVRPHVAIVTTIAPAHMGFFADEEAIADAKGEIFQGLESGGTAIVPHDSPPPRPADRGGQALCGQDRHFRASGGRRLSRARDDAHPHRRHLRHRALRAARAELHAVAAGRALGFERDGDPRRGRCGRRGSRAGRTGAGRAGRDRRARRAPDGAGRGAARHW
jgi:hypothetical protein